MIAYIGLGLAILIVVGCFTLVIRRLMKADADDDLRREKMREASEAGIDAKGRILIVSRDATRGHSTHLVHMSVEISTADGNHYTVMKQAPVSRDDYWEIDFKNIHLFSKDAVLPMKVHSEDRDWYFFQFEIDDRQNFRDYLDMKKSLKCDK